ncbi:HAD hydrolase-like protein [Burkholderia sp. AU6039]|uniref:HAD hydrolase-like protein n=1 Tax=Burkholderia sp. AU6039 TaxID=2015344 RepID=UPI00117F7B9F
MIAESNGLDPSQITYVGDRFDNDVEPARQAGMVSVFSRRDRWHRSRVALGTVFDPDPRHRRSFFTTGCVARDPSTHRPPRASFHIRCFPTSRRNRLPARSPHRGSR